MTTKCATIPGWHWVKSRHASDWSIVWVMTNKAYMYERGTISEKQLHGMDVSIPICHPTKEHEHFDPSIPGGNRVHGLPIDKPYAGWILALDMMNTVPEVYRNQCTMCIYLDEPRLGWEFTPKT